MARATVMPDGRDYPEECIHRLSSEHAVSTVPGVGDVLTELATGKQTVLPPCPTQVEKRLGYYSDWVVDVFSVHDDIGRMASSWTVPAAPKSRGPVPGMSAVYLFNGLEDGAGERGKASVILQPVLSYGRSGCVLNPLAGWEFTAFQVSDAGRAYCGPHFSVNEGDNLQGIMEVASTGADGTTWNIIADGGPRGRSVHQATFPAGHRFNAAYLTLEGMVIYNCDALPGEGLDFTANTLSSSDSTALQPQWQTEVRHSECQPAAKVSGDTVSFTWASSAPVAV